MTEPHLATNRPHPILVPQNARRSAVGPDLQPLLSELHAPGRSSFKVPHAPPHALDGIPAQHRRKTPPGLPEIDEPTVVHHFVRLSHLNYSVDSGIYPLGSCTMKYNPKVNEWAARLPGFALLHPLAPDELAQGSLELMWTLQQQLGQIGGFPAVSLQPAAGAHGELTGILVIRAYHLARGDIERDEVIVPDSSHGTNPATASMAGFKTVTVTSGSDGMVDLEALKRALGPRTAAVMLTNPSTLGLFEHHVVELLDAVHGAGALAYMDGANMNAVLGHFRPGEAGFDVMHFNLHKTFSTPHGGGGPGAGPVGVKNVLVPHLPTPVVQKQVDGSFALDHEFPHSIGRLHANFGNVGMLVRAYAYIRALGPDGLKRCAEMAVLNANYLLARLRESYHVPYPGHVMHECVLTDRSLHDFGVSTLDVAKRLIDYGYHPPTIYFPLIVNGAIMIEPTESESLEGLDRFADALLAIAEEAREDPERVRSAPHHTRRSRLDETRAARKPVLRWQPAQD
jgi:glycine dehydrogenase subunit 2